MREGAEDARARARPQRRAHQGLSDREPRAVGAPAPRLHTAQADRREPAHQQGRRLRRGHGALLREGRRSSLRAGEAVRLDPRLPGRRQVAHLGARLPAVEQVRVHRAGAPGLRDQLADRLRRRRSVVLARRALHRRVRQRRRARGDARRRVPAAVRLQLRRAAPERQDPRALRQSLRRAGAVGAPVAAEGDPPAAGARHLPGAQPLHARMPVTAATSAPTPRRFPGRRRRAT